MFTIRLEILPEGVKLFPWSDGLGDSRPFWAYDWIAEHGTLALVACIHILYRLRPFLCVYVNRKN